MTPFERFVTVIVTPGSAPPDSSVTVPPILAAPTCAAAEDAPASASSSAPNPVAFARRLCIDLLPVRFSSLRGRRRRRWPQRQLVRPFLIDSRAAVHHGEVLASVPQRQQVAVVGTFGLTRLSRHVRDDRAVPV